MMKKEFAITSETMAILPHWNEYGFLHSQICDRTTQRIVPLSPLQLIDLNLKFMGSSLQAATLASRATLGAGQKYPLMLNEKHSIVLLPNCSAYREDCTWFILRYIKKTLSINRSTTKVILRNGGSIILDTSKPTIDARISRAYELCYKIQQRPREFGDLLAETEAAYHLEKGDGGRNYGEEMGVG